MATDSQRQRGGDSAHSTLNTATEVLNLAKEIWSVTPVKIVFGSVSAMLTMIGVRFFPFCGGEFHIDVYKGLNGQRQRLRWPWVILRRRL